MEEINDTKYYEAILVSIIGICIIIVMLVFTVIILINYKTWANERDKHYAEKHDSLEKKFDNIKDSTSKVIEDASKVVEAAGKVITKK